MAKKSLKIKFVKFECALAMQVLEMNGKFSDSPVGLNGNGSHILIGVPRLNEGCLGDDRVWIFPVLTVRMRMFASNTVRDEYLDKVIKWISEEQFGVSGKLEIGKLYTFSDNGKRWVNGVYAGKCAAQLGEPRFLALDGDVSLTRWKYVFPFDGVSLRIVDDVYTWEMEVSE